MLNHVTYKVRSENGYGFFEARSENGWNEVAIFTILVRCNKNIEFIFRVP